MRYLRIIVSVIGLLAAGDAAAHALGEGDCCLPTVDRGEAAATGFCGGCSPAAADAFPARQGAADPICPAPEGTPIESHGDQRMPPAWTEACASSGTGIAPGFCPCSCHGLGLLLGAPVATTAAAPRELIATPLACCAPGFTTVPERPPYRA
jgi:hypothetical protein